MSIELVGILALGNDRYRLDFWDGGAAVSFVLKRVPRKGILISQEFGQHFDGRASGQEAFEALESFARGQHIAFPIEVREDGFTGIGR